MTNQGIIKFNSFLKHRLMIKIKILSNKNLKISKFFDKDPKINMNLKLTDKYHKRISNSMVWKNLWIKYKLKPNQIKIIHIF